MDVYPSDSVSPKTFPQTVPDDVPIVYSDPLLSSRGDLIGLVFVVGGDPSVPAWVVRSKWPEDGVLKDWGSVGDGRWGDVLGMKEIPYMKFKVEVGGKRSPSPKWRDSKSKR